jgi:hypothetical protein
MSLYKKLIRILESNDGHPPESYEMPSRWILPRAKHPPVGTNKPFGHVPTIMSDHNGWGRNFWNSQNVGSLARMMKDGKGPIRKDPENDLDPIEDQEKKYLRSKITQDRRKSIKAVK